MGQSNTSKGAIVVVVAIVATLLVGAASVSIVINRNLPTPTVSTSVPTPTVLATSIAQLPTTTATASLSPTTPAPTVTVVSPTVLPPTFTATATDTTIPSATLTDSPTTAFTATSTASATATITTTATLTPSLTATLFPIPAFQTDGASSLYVPRLGWTRAIGIITLPIIGNTWDVTNLGHSIGHLDQTSWVGDQGNIVLVAHIQLAVGDYGPFLYLKKMEVGDPIYVVDQNMVYAYVVTDKTTVDPTDVSVTNPTVDPTVTLITCTVWDATHGLFAKRLVITGKRVRVAPLGQS